jgi:hypothetical protein
LQRFLGKRAHGGGLQKLSTASGSDAAAWGLRFGGLPERECRKTVLLAPRVDLPALRWGQGEQRLDPKMVERHGYEYARRKGMVSMIGGKDKKAKRNATPPEFRDLLLSIARTADRRHAP